MSRQKQPNSIPIEECFAKNITFAAILKSKFIKIFISIIKAMNFVKSTDIKLSINGLKYIVEESKSFQTTAYIRKEFFSFFRLRIPEDEEISFGVNLSSLTELLSALLDDEMSNMKVVYYHQKNCMLFTCEQKDSGPKNNLKSNLDLIDEDDDDEEKPITTEYFVKTMESFEPIDFNRPDDFEKFSSLIIDSCDLYSLLCDLDKNAVELELQINESGLQFSTIGALQVKQVAKIPNNEELFSRFDLEKPSKFIYKFIYFKVIMKALNLSKKTSMQTFADGLLRIQLMIDCEDDESSAFIEYNCLSCLEDDE
jgi:hypothetical protein